MWMTISYLSTILTDLEHLKFFRNRKIPKKSKLMVEGWVDRVWFVGYDICW
jgi:hypothetical protein